MSQATKNQFYRYSMRSTLILNQFMCTKRIMVHQLPPDSALSIENLFMRLRFTFSSTLLAGQNVLYRVGIISDYPAYGQQDAESWVRYLTLNQAADGNNQIDLNLDLSHLLKKDNIDAVGTGSATLVYIETAVASNEVSIDILANAGTINICKLDGIYTTREIR